MGVITALLLLLSAFLFSLPAEAHAGTSTEIGQALSLEDEAFSFAMRTTISATFAPTLTESFRQDGWSGILWVYVMSSCSCPWYGQQFDKYRSITNLDLARVPFSSGSASAVKLTTQKLRRTYYGLKFDQHFRHGVGENRWLDSYYVGIQNGFGSMKFRSNTDSAFVGLSWRETARSRFNRRALGGLIGANLHPMEGVSAQFGTAFIPDDVAVEAKIQYSPTDGGLFGADSSARDRISAEIDTSYIDRDLTVQAKIRYAF